jgi:hypothetical protein
VRRFKAGEAVLCRTWPFHRLGSAQPAAWLMFGSTGQQGWGSHSLGLTTSVSKSGASAAVMAPSSSTIIDPLGCFALPALKARLLLPQRFPQDRANADMYMVPFTRVVYIERADFRTADAKDYYGLAPGKTAMLRCERRPGRQRRDCCLCIDAASME